MPRRTNREERKSSHHNPGRNLSARARAERDQLRRDRREDVERPTSERRPRAAPAPTTLVVVCPTGKLGFTRQRAEEKLAEYQSSPRPPARVYACGKCSTPRLEVWHLTSEAARAPDPRPERRPMVPPAPPRPEWMR